MLLSQLAPYKEQIQLVVSLEQENKKASGKARSKYIAAKEALNSKLASRSIKEGLIFKTKVHFIFMYNDIRPVTYSCDAYTHTLTESLNNEFVHDIAKVNNLRDLSRTAKRRYATSYHLKKFASYLDCQLLVEHSPEEYDITYLEYMCLYFPELKNL